MGLDKIEKQGSGKRKNVNVLTPGTESVKSFTAYFDAKDLCISQFNKLGNVDGFMKKPRKPTFRLQ